MPEQRRSVPLNVDEEAAIEANKAAALARRRRRIEEQSSSDGNPGTNSVGRRVTPLDDEEAEAPLEERQWQL